MCVCIVYNRWDWRGLECFLAVLSLYAVILCWVFFITECKVKITFCTTPRNNDVQNCKYETRRKHSHAWWDWWAWAGRVGASQRGPSAGWGWGVLFKWNITAPSLVSPRPAAVFDITDLWSMSWSGAKRGDVWLHTTFSQSNFFPTITSGFGPTAV